MPRETFFRSIGGLIAAATILQAAAIFVWWGLDSPQDRWAQVAGYIISGVLGAVIGFHMHEGSRTRTAFSLSWRVSVGWFLIWALMEYLVQDQNSLYAVTMIVETFLGHALAIAGAFVLAHTAHEATKGVQFTIKDFIQTMGALAAVAALIVALATIPEKGSADNKTYEETREPGEQP